MTTTLRPTRVAVVHLRVRETEKATLEAAAEAADLSLSSYIRRAALAAAATTSATETT